MFGRGNRNAKEIQEAQKELKHRGAIRQILDGAAKEFGFAVADVRNELIDRAWFDRDAGAMYQAQSAMSLSDFEKCAERDYSRDDVYGRDPFEDRDHDIERDDLDR